MTGISPVSYESFSTSNQSIVPWGAWSVNDTVGGCHVGNLVDRSDPFSDYMILCDVWAPFRQTLYHPTMEANISINLADYGGATSLEFTWTYWPMYFGTNMTAGTLIPVYSQVGDAGFDDNFPSVTSRSIDQSPNPWNNTPKISHSGSTSVVRGSDATIGYIAVKINVTMSTATVPNITDPLQDIALWVEDIGINITTPLQSSTSAASSVPSSSSSLPSSSTTVPVGVIVGATIGAIVFVALIVAALLLFRRRWQRAKGHIADATPFTEPVDHKDPLPHEGEVPIPWVGPDSAQLTPGVTVEPNDRPSSSWLGENVSGKLPGSILNRPDTVAGLVAATASGVEDSGQSLSSNGVPPEIPPNTGRPLSMHSSSFSAMPDDPPPIYNLEESVVQARAMPPSLSPEPASTSGMLPPVFSPELARFATANRDIINESLETRLQAAGYLPTDDPSNLTPEQWRTEHGITRLELRRLQNLYARNR